MHNCSNASSFAWHAGGLVGITFGYKMYTVAGGEVGVARWEQTDGGKDRNIPAAIFMPWALSCTISDAVVSMLLRPTLQQVLGMDQVDGDKND